ncbi:cytosolic carboxypeptidase 2 isoform X3 [Alligator mississippiensis]|uniref:cytosolic carboxypeptidase 2 isoform X3 n=1 Tax=Alligator mississippiensis TaxID=8496 RepID=UPI00090702F8|nr:cytosolic carboxypeptidase 2 isoform X3 [Alligator mississippiensis]
MRPAPEPGAELLADPYESFMYHHLRYYGYFKGQEKALQNNSILPSGHQQKSSTCLLKQDGFQESNKSNQNSLQDKKKLICSLMLEAALLKNKQVLVHHPESLGFPCLREPRGLFTLPTSGSLLQAPQWPIECEVIKEQIQHIEWVPPNLEPFYQLTGNEKAPEIVGEEKGTVVYHINPAAKGTCFTCARVGGTRGPVRSPAVTLEGPEDTTLLFESRFESGNLQKAVRVGPYDYELTLRTDLYTSKHTQWFYFRVRNTRKDILYRFTIVNLMKPKSLYSMGMKPLLYSERDAQTNGIGWRREGADICYYRCSSKEKQATYCLTWTVHFPHDHDTCYFAHSYPYTYSDLQRYLLAMTNDTVYSQYCKLRALCQSLAGNTVYLLTITSPSRNPDEAAAKKAVVLSARVHPGETSGSWVMRGFLDFILSNAPDAQLLRELFIFKVVPMLNPDGVIVGNYRCSLAGRDLNRNYKTILKESFPCIWHTRAMIKRVLEKREILLYCDLHGHSRKNNVFMYGCNNKGPTAQQLHERIFPLMLSKNAPDKFSFHSCKFKVQKSKEGTGRIVMWRMGIPNSYTMESTFGGSTLGKKSDSHFTSEDLKSLGYHICDTLLDFCDPDRSKFLQCMAELQELLRQQICQKLKERGHKEDLDGTWSDNSLSDIESSTSGSNSSHSDGLPAHLLSLAEKFNQKKRKKRWLRTRKERNELHQKYTLPQKMVRVAPSKSRKRPAFFKNSGRCSSAGKRTEQMAEEKNVASPMCRVHQPVSTLSLCMENSSGKQGKNPEDIIMSYLQRRKLNAIQESRHLKGRLSWHTFSCTRPCPHEISHQLSPLVKNLWKTHRPHLIPVIPLLRTQKPLLVPLKQYHPPFQSQLDGQPPEEQPTGLCGGTLKHQPQLH